MAEPNAAVVPEAPEPEERTYKVTGKAQETLGHKLGETFTALLDADQEAALIAGGAIQIVNTQRETDDSRSRKPAKTAGDDPNTAPKE